MSWSFVEKGSGFSAGSTRHRSALAQGLVKGLDNGFEQVLEDGIAAGPDLDGGGHARLQAGTVTLNPERDAVIAEHDSEKLIQPLAA